MSKRTLNGLLTSGYFLYLLLTYAIYGVLIGITLSANDSYVAEMNANAWKADLIDMGILLLMDGGFGVYHLKWMRRELSG